VHSTDDTDSSPAQVGSGVSSAHPPSSCPASGTSRARSSAHLSSWMNPLDISSAEIVFGYTTARRTHDARLAIKVDTSERLSCSIYLGGGAALFGVAVRVVPPPGLMGCGVFFVGSALVGPDL
jgi:hypothetical protein